jgi:hypothetical protein
MVQDTSLELFLGFGESKIDAEQRERGRSHGSNGRSTCEHGLAISLKGGRSIVPSRKNSNLFSQKQRSCDEI